jgi:hypothetical protein
MKRDMQTFADSTNAILQQLQMEDPGVGGPDATIKVLATKLTLAQQIETKANVANDRLEDASRKVIAADRIAKSATERLNALAAELPGGGDHREQISNLETREKVRERLRQRRETLVPLIRGESEADLREDLASFDEDAALAEIEDLRRQDTKDNESENNVYADLSGKERELANLEAGIGAELALQTKKKMLRRS